jgi:Pvc16 N-terminal domain/IPT/TIG domain
VSNYLAVGGVSAVLRSILTSALTNGGPTSILNSAPKITATSPDLVPTGTDEKARLNLFMYYASLNPALRNLDLPSRNARGTQLSNPPLAVNLHYLVTAYGSNQFDPEILLAWAMKIFHDTPVVPRLTIENALDDLLNNPTTPEGTLISGCLLARQIEHIRVTPETLTTEEIYRLWTAFQTHYRPTTSYQVSVVVIQDTNVHASNLPVRQRTVTALPLQAPLVDTLSPSMLAAGGTLTVLGSNLLGTSPGDTLVSFDSAPGVAPLTVQDNVLTVVVPNTLQAGTRSLRVLRTITYPLTNAPHTGFTSSPAQFQLLPAIMNAPPIAVARGATLTLTLTPAVARAQQATLYVGDNAIPIDQRSPTGPATSATLDFPIPTAFPTGSYPLRVEIDGAQSKLTLDTTQGSATYGLLLPQLQVTP